MHSPSINRFTRSSARAASALAVAGTLLLPLSATPSFGADDSKTIKIAIDLPFNTSGADTQLSVARAFELAVKEAGTLPGGYHLKTIRFDHGDQKTMYNVDLAAQNARDNVADPQILAVYGTQNSAAAKAEIPILNTAGLAMVSAVNTNPTLTKGDEAQKLRTSRPHENAYFRVCGTDDLQGAAGAQFAEQRGWKTAYVIDNNSTYGKGIADVFDVTFKSGGGSVLAHDQIDGLGVRDFSKLIAKIKDSHAQVVYFGADGEQLGVFRKQMADAQLADVPLVGGDGMTEDDYPKAAGTSTYNSFYTVMTPNGTYLENRIAKHFVNAFRGTYGKDPLPYDAGAYAAAQVEIRAIRNAIKDNGGKLPTRDQVRTWIAHTSNSETAIGPITFNPEGDVRNPWVSYYTFDKDGKTKFVRQFVFHTQ